MPVATPRHPSQVGPVHNRWHMPFGDRHPSVVAPPHAALYIEGEGPSGYRRMLSAVFAHTGAQHDAPSIANIALPHAGKQRHR